MEVPGSANAVRNEPSFKDFLKKANSGVIEEDGSNKFRRSFRDILDLENQSPHFQQFLCSLKKWQEYPLIDQNDFPCLSDNAGCLVIHKDVSVGGFGQLEYTKQMVGQLDAIESSIKLQRCGIYIYGGINEKNEISDKLIHVCIEGKKVAWTEVPALGIQPPPLFSHSMSFLKDRKLRSKYGFNSQIPVSLSMEGGMTSQWCRIRSSQD